MPKLTDVNGLEVLKFTETASAVNEFTIANAAASGSPTLSATGDDTNISIALTPKGTGSVVTARGISQTIADTANTIGYTLVQNDTTNNPKGISVTNAGTGNSVFIDANGDTGSAASTSGALLIENTGNAGFGLNAYSNHATFAQSLAFMKLDNAGATGNVLRLDNDGGGHSLHVNANGETSVSTSVGGAMLLTNTGNVGSGLVIYSNAGASTSGARLLSIRADNPAYDQAVMAISNDGTGAALSINGTGGTGVGLTISSAGTGTNHTLGANYTGTSTTAAAGSFTSTNPNFTAFQVTGQELAHGTIKVSHTGTGTDADAAALSIDLKGTGTAAQGIFIDATEGGTTGKLLNLRNNGTEYFSLTSAGKVGIQRASPVGKFEVAGANTIASGTSATLDNINFLASTVTVSGSDNITTAAGFNYANIGTPSYSAASALTITNAATLYIANAPQGGGAGPATISNAYSLWVDNGNVRFDGNMELGAASDTTIARSGAGDITIEGNAVYRAGGTDVPVTDGGTGASTAAAARTNIGTMWTAVFASSNLAAGPADATTYYFGFPYDVSINNTTAGLREQKMPFAGVLRGASITVIATAGSTTEASTVYARINNTTDVQLSNTVTMDQTAQQFTATGLSQAIAAGDEIEIKVVTPTWVTNPTNVRIHVTLFIE